MDQSFMKERKILPLVLSMSLPMVISMAVNALYNIVDSYFVAKLSEEAMTALALVYPIQNLITAIGVGIGIGINAGIAYYLGAKKQTTANQIATQGIALSVLHDLWVSDQHSARSADDLWNRPISGYGDCRCRLCDRNRTDGDTADLPHLLFCRPDPGQDPVKIFKTGETGNFPYLCCRHSGDFKYGTSVSADFIFKWYPVRILGEICAGAWRIL